MLDFRNRIKNSELETREVFEWKTENIPLTQQKYLVTTLNNNTLTLSTDSSKHENMNEPEVHSDPELSLSDSSSKSSL